MYADVITVYAGCLMDEDFKGLTSFFFDHKIPDSVSSTVTQLFTCVDSEDPPYRTHEWMLDGAAINLNKAPLAEDSFF